MDKRQIKVFDTAGPCVPFKRYMLPVLPRQPEVEVMIAGEHYFTLHGPRQSGKTTYFMAIAKEINDEN
ncbi:MAG: hypothetical protein LBF58_12295 [Deltaproteobacteria bacterium]|jgi:hypothetical protein|nr:hypothetical protein [Deltaproteobacteria bacterium]